MKPIYIDGEAGTTGLQIREKLAAVPEIEILSLPTERRKDVQKKREIMATVGLVILCLPDDAAREAVELIDAMPDKRPKILDASTAHRVADGWVFGLPELGPEQEAAIIAAAKVSNPDVIPPVRFAEAAGCGGHHTTRLSDLRARGIRLFRRRPKDDRSVRERHGAAF